MGKILDERDAKIRGMLQAVKDNSAELAALAAEAEEELKKARAEAQARIAEVKVRRLMGTAAHWTPDACVPSSVFRYPVAKGGSPR